MSEAIVDIEDELEERLVELRAQDKLLEAQRLEQRTLYDLEMLREVGHCSGIENYSRHLARREPGSTPWRLVDYFPDDFLMVIDESLTCPFPRLRACILATAAAKRCWSSMASACPAPWTTARSTLRSGKITFTR